MEAKDYLEILLKGSIKIQFFADHLKREWEKAKIKNYSIDASIDGLYGASNFIKNTGEEKKRHEISVV